MLFCLRFSTISSITNSSMVSSLCSSKHRPRQVMFSTQRQLLHSMSTIHSKLLGKLAADLCGPYIGCVQMFGRLHTGYPLKVRTHEATNRSDMSRGQVASCDMVNNCKDLCPSNRIVSQGSVTQNQTGLLLCDRSLWQNKRKPCCSDLFWKWYTLCKRQRPVAAICCLVCPGLKTNSQRKKEKGVAALLWVKS